MYQALRALGQAAGMAASALNLNGLRVMNGSVSPLCVCLRLILEVFLSISDAYTGVINITVLLYFPMFNT